MSNVRRAVRMQAAHAHDCCCVLRPCGVGHSPCRACMSRIDVADKDMRDDRASRRLDARRRLQPSDHAHSRRPQGRTRFLVQRPWYRRNESKLIPTCLIGNSFRRIRYPPAKECSAAMRLPCDSVHGGAMRRASIRTRPTGRPPATARPVRAGRASQRSSAQASGTHLVELRRALGQPTCGSLCVCMIAVTRMEPSSTVGSMTIFMMLGNVLVVCAESGGLRRALRDGPPRAKAVAAGESDVRARQHTAFDG